MYDRRQPRGLNVRGRTCRLSKQADISLIDTHATIKRRAEEVLYTRAQIQSGMKRGLYVCGHHADYVARVTRLVARAL